MTILKEFSYSDTFMRKISGFNGFITFFLTGFILSDISLTMKKGLFYFPVMEAALISALAGVFAGNLFGRLLYGFIKNSRIVYIISEVLFTALASVYILRGFAGNESGKILFTILSYSRYAVPGVIAAICFFTGIKLNYFLKISCGDYIDDREGLISYTGFSLLGIFAGIALPLMRFYPEASEYWKDISQFPALLSALLVPSLFLMKLPYNPKLQYASYIPDENETVRVEESKNESLIFTYLNFSYVIIYAYLALQSIIKYYGDFLYIKIFFILVVSGCLLLGFGIGHLIKRGFLHIYTEMLFPLFFLPSVFIIHFSHEHLPFYYGAAVFSPALVLFGISLNHTMKNIIRSFGHNARFRIIEFSLLILPAPILASVIFIDFTNLLFYSFVYILALLNIFIPGLFIVSGKMSGYKKALYFFFSFVFIISVIFAHIYFGIDTGKDIYVKRTGNFEELKRTNFNAHFIKNRAEVLMNGFPIFRLSDSLIRNLKSSLVPLALYYSEEKGGVLFLDGNRRFFRNPVTDYYGDSLCVDILSDENVDFDRLPVSGRHIAVPEREYLLLYLNETNKKYFSIVDIPNILDQTFNYYRFTGEYYRKIKERLLPGGIFIQQFNLNDVRKEFLRSSLVNLKAEFKNHTGYLFSDMLVIMSSNSENAFNIGRGNFERLKKFIESHKEPGILFYNEYHILSHLVFTDMEKILKYLPEVPVTGDYILSAGDKSGPVPGLYEDYGENNLRFLELVKRDTADPAFIKDITSVMKRDGIIYSLIKKTEYAESRGNYEEETEYLFELKKAAEQREELREYLKNILSYKEAYYYNTAQRLEKEKRWEEARVLYRASLRINEKSFDANYRLGLLCITLQDLENAFKYLQSAMKLDRDHPGVLYQMGVLLFSNGRIKEAIVYFNRALARKELSASLFLYLGLSYEKLGMFSEAESYYERALIQDPNDENIKIRLEKIRLRIKKELEKTWWKPPSLRNDFEAELDENFPLPINKSAYKWRLTDKEADKIKK